MGSRRDSSGPTSPSVEEIAETELAATPGRDALDPLLAELVTPPASEPAPGAWIGRFQILRLLGRGGFGIVYEARDRELGRRVAVKVVRLARAGSSEALLALFKNEAESAAHLNHPNIVTIHDFGTHEGMPYVILELLEGETLQQRLAGGPLPAPDALAIAVQLARGLAHAHAAGILHRDIKPANLFLRADGQVKILDFGLAGFFGAMATARAVISPGGGTPAYMAPEQWHAQEDARADVFSAGVVLYQMLTGELPYEVTSGKRSDLERPPSERELRQALARSPRGVAEVAVRALAHDADQRFADGGALLRALEAVATPRGRRTALLVAATAALAAVALALVWPRSRPLPALGPGDGRRTLAVMGLVNQRGDPASAWVGPTLTELLGTELSPVPRLRLVPRDEAQRARRELAAPGPSLSPEALHALRSSLGADLVITGAYTAAEGSSSIQVDLGVQDTASGETVVVVHVPGDASDVVALAANLGQALRERLGVEPLSTAVAAQVRAALPRGSAAARAYAEAVTRLRDRECTRARELLVEAVRADERFALAHSALADADGCLGFDVRAREEASRAFELSVDLPRKERLWIEAQHWQLQRSQRRALDVVRTLWALAPDDLDVGLRLIGFYAPDAKLALAALRNLPPPISDSPLLDLAAAGGIGINASHEETAANARRAQERARASGSRAMLAMAYLYEASPLVRIGRFEEAERLARQAIELEESMGNRVVSSDAELVVGQARLALNDIDAAAATTERVAATSKAIGDEERFAMAVQRLSKIYLKGGDLAKARARAEDLTAWCAERGRLGGMAMAAATLADIGLGEGDPRRARKSLDLAVALGEEAQRSDLNAVRQPLDPQAFPFELPFAEDDAVAGITALQRALDTATRLGAVSNAAWFLTIMGYHELERDPAQAAAQARQALSTLAKLTGGPREPEALARAVLAAALAAQGDEVQAMVAMALAEPPLESTQWRRAHVWGRILSARTRTRAGDGVAPALARLDALVVPLEAQGQVALALEVRLELGRLELAGGAGAPGRLRLRGLARDAEARGFKYFARLAREALETPAR